MQKLKKVQVGLFEKMPADPLLMILTEVQIELFEKMMGATLKVVLGKTRRTLFRLQKTFCRPRRESAREKLQPDALLNRKLKRQETEAAGI